MNLLVARGAVSRFPPMVTILCVDLLPCYGCLKKFLPYRGHDCLLDELYIWSGSFERSSQAPLMYLASMLGLLRRLLPSDF